MKLGISGVLSSVFALAAVMVSTGRAAPLPVSVDLAALRAIQTYALEDKADDQAYVVVNATVKGEAVPVQKLPKEQPWTAGPRKPPVTTKAPLALWTGELDSGEFAVVTISLFQGKGSDDAPIKEYSDKLAAGDKDVPALAKKTLGSNDDLKALAAATLKAHRAVVTKIKDTFSREKKTDHFGGQFTVILWNNDGKLIKRLDPVGLTFGEHFGNDVKMYTKIKFTRANVLEKDDSGEWSEVQVAPLSDDELTARVKMLETEIVKTPERPIRNVTDYVAELQIKAGGKPQKWQLEGENAGPSDLHTYWDYAR